jgi:glycine betaine transporter
MQGDREGVVTVERPASPRIDPTVFWTAAVLSAVFVAWGILFTDNLAAVFNAVLFNFLVPNFGWVFILATFGFLVFSLYLAFSRYGGIRLGGQDEQPEFRTVSWVAMMFSAGMGIGLMFFGVAEPLSHMSSPPAGTAEAGTREAAQVGMEYSYFHWAFHPWAIYAIMGLALAYFTFRKGMPNLISTAFYPLLGERVYGPIGKTIDILAIFATLFGSATSLGLGALQINQGLEAVFGFGGREAVGLAIVIIAVLTLAFILSAVSGVHRGIQWIANTNMVLAVFLVVFVFVLGPTVFILRTFTESLGDYLFNLIPMSFRAGAFSDAAFVSAWTVFYWAWWISWAPFVGTFIARISRGRTIREFVFGVILAPSVVSFVWFAVLGGTAINLQLSGAVNNLAETAANNQPGALFLTLEQFPLFWLTALITIILVALFFVSGADAASVVMGMLSSQGNLHPRRWTLVVWGTFTGAAAAICLLAGAIQGSVDVALSALQAVAIASAAPFLLVLIGLCFSILKALRSEPGVAPEPRAVPDPGRAMSRPGGAPAPQRMAAENPQPRQPYRG